MTSERRIWRRHTLCGSCFTSAGSIFIPMARSRFARRYRAFLQLARRATTPFLHGDFAGALSPGYYAGIIELERAFDHCCISTSGARPNPQWLAAFLDLGLQIYCGFDTDPTGESAAKAMLSLYPAIQRLRPSRHDWNAVLISQFRERRRSGLCQ